MRAAGNRRRHPPARELKGRAIAAARGAARPLQAAPTWLWPALVEAAVEQRWPVALALQINGCGSPKALFDAPLDAHVDELSLVLHLLPDGCAGLTLKFSCIDHGNYADCNGQEQQVSHGDRLIQLS